MKHCGANVDAGKLLLTVFLAMAGCSVKDSLGNGIISARLEALEEARKSSVERPSLDSSLCRQSVPVAPLAELTHSSNAYGLVKDIAGEQIAASLKVVPGEFEWWLSRMSSVTLQSMAIALHETNHRANYVLTLCNPGHRAYLLGGKNILLDGDLDVSIPYYKIEEVAAGNNFSKSHRFLHYIKGSARSDGNTFFVLLDELNAYIVAAQFELATARLTEESQAPTNFGLMSRDSNVGGAVEFQAYVVAYIGMICALPDKKNCSKVHSLPVKEYLHILFAEVRNITQAREGLQPHARSELQIPEAAMVYLATPKSKEVLATFSRLRD